MMAYAGPVLGSVCVCVGGGGGGGVETGEWVGEGGSGGGEAYAASQTTMLYQPKLRVSYFCMFIVSRSSILDFYITLLHLVFNAVWRP